MTQADSVHSTPPTNTSPDDPAKPQDSLYFKTPVTPEEIFKAIGALRKEARDEIHRLIRFLDDTDRHIAIEDSAVDDGPCDGDELDGQEDGSDQDDEPDSENEPSLGSPGNFPGPWSSSACDTQETWSSGNRDEREGDEHDGREPDDEGGEAVKEDDEPSLGWTAGEASRGRMYAGSCGATADLEEQCEDEGDQSDTGIGDFDGLMEQCPELFAHCDVRVEQ